MPGNFYAKTDNVHSNNYQNGYVRHTDALSKGSEWKQIIDFTDLTTAASSSTAESYTIFKTVELLTQQNYQGLIQIFTDVSSFKENSNLPYLQQAHELASQNNIDLTISRQNISPERINDPRIPKIKALLNNFNCLNITLNITLHKIITSRAINRITLTTLLEKTDYVPEEKEKQKLRKLINDLEGTLKIE
ncbi:8232_t:CDS:2 [Cetraspora pellucida]|uniref:8232_t:CDS:1 n=1 Tax=Cetraspora pellucida TaxID=1433469 RepID=A0ACA9L2M4_9GLOM|nr:8232_t:CDS:2 [Cetraspora pellucida]